MTGTPASASQPQADTLSDSEFKALLAGVIPHLRAYGRSLSGNPDLADDLTQDTMVKAWASRERFERGTSIKAWTFVILRNTFLRSEEHTSELQSLMRISYAVFCLKKQKNSN